MADTNKQIVVRCTEELRGKVDAFAASQTKKTGTPWDTSKAVRYLVERGLREATRDRS